MAHLPVLQKEVLEYLDPKPNENFIDCTIGSGGHALAILEKTSPKGKVLGIDLDCLVPGTKYPERLILTRGNFANLKEIIAKEKFKKISGILFDLGMSSWHLEESKKGFSFLRNEPLDMRYSQDNSSTAEKIINYGSYQEIEKILREYGQEQFADKITREILEIRKLRAIKTTFQLVEIIKKATPVFYQHKKIHFATKTFQALRIAVNDELNNLEKVLPQTLEVFKKRGRLLIISFHSLEDRIVKNFFRERAKEGLLKILTKKPITPSKDEIKMNPRSRSAKLRAAIRI